MLSRYSSLLKAVSVPRSASNGKVRATFDPRSEEQFFVKLSVVSLPESQLPNSTSVYCQTVSTEDTEQYM